MLDNLENESPTSLVFDSARRTFESLTIYYELSAARIPEEFAPVRLRLQREWTFNGGFVSRFTFFDSQLIFHSTYSSYPWLRKFIYLFLVVGELTTAFRANASMFAITPDSVFKINSHAFTAVATSSTACGLGLACDVWFLLRYNLTDLETFIVCTLLTLLSTQALIPFTCLI